MQYQGSHILKRTYHILTKGLAFHNQSTIFLELSSSNGFAAPRRKESTSNHTYPPAHTTRHSLSSGLRKPWKGWTNASIEKWKSERANLLIPFAPAADLGYTNMHSNAFQMYFTSKVMNNQEIHSYRKATGLISYPRSIFLEK